MRLIDHHSRSRGVHPPRPRPRWLFESARVASSSSLHICSDLRVSRTSCTVMGLMAGTLSLYDVLGVEQTAPPEARTLIT
jgi:hypothetical protein